MRFAQWRCVHSWSYGEAFPERRGPNTWTTSRLVARFRNAGVNDRDLQCKPIGNIPAKLTKKAHTETVSANQMSYEGLRRATNKEETMSVIAITLYVRFKNLISKGKRLHCCQWFLRFIRNSFRVLNYVFYSVEAWFHLSGNLNSQMDSDWSSDDPSRFPWYPITFVEDKSLACNFGKF